MPARVPKPPHVCIFLPSLAGGGAERIMLALGAEFARRGVVTELLVASAKGDLAEHVPREIALVDFNKKKAIHAVPRLAFHLRRTRPDALLATILPANIAASLASKLAGGTRLVLREANFPEYDTIGRRPLDTFANRFMARMLYPRASRLIVMSEAMKLQVQQFHDSDKLPIEVIPNPCLRNPPAADEPLAGRDTPPLLLWAGRFEEQKDPFTMLRAFARIRSLRPARLAMLGAGSLRLDVEREVARLGLAGDVMLPGFVHDISDWLRRCSVFVHTARWEGFANVLIEALSYDLPVVATDCPGAVMEILGGGRFGALVPVGEPDRLAETVTRVLDGALAFVNPRVHLRQFDIENVADRYLDVLIGKRRWEHSRQGSGQCAE
jgi:glycosyltransferase involved in cell wall biosynthesis